MRIRTRFIHKSFACLVSYSSRVQRLCALCASLFLTLMTNAMWYGRKHADSKQTYHIGPLVLSSRAIFTGFVSALIEIIPAVLIVGLFQRRCPRGNARYKQWTFPWWVIFVAYFLVFCSVGTGVVVCFFYSLEWGQEKSAQWLLSMIFSVFTTTGIIQPLKVHSFQKIFSSHIW